ncbi:MAG: THxN family PEP-CTERM protein [Pseudomonadota bacterium]
MRFKQLMVAGMMLAGAGVANADPSIPSFDFETTTGFIDSGWTCEGGAVDANICSMNFSNVNTDGTYRNLAWGTEANPEDAQSYLEITNIAGTIITNGGWVDINYFDHYNHIITSAGGNMETVGVSGLFELVAPLYFPVGGVNGVLFDETFNVDSDDCPGPNPNDSACDDIFRTGGLQGSIPFFYDGGGWYVLSFQFFAGPGTTVVDNGDGTFTIYTTEACSTDGEAGCGEGEVYSEGFSRLITQARIDYIVPTPETLALLGVGLLAFSLRRPRKN